MMANSNSFLCHRSCDCANYEEERKYSQVIDHTFGMEGGTNQTIGFDRYLVTHEWTYRTPSYSVSDVDYPLHGNAHLHDSCDSASNRDRDSSQDYNSITPLPFTIVSSNQRPRTVNASQLSYANPTMAVSDIPSSPPSESSQAYYPFRPLPSPADNLINSTIYPDEGQLGRCYCGLTCPNSILSLPNTTTPTAQCDETSREYASHMPESQRGLVDTPLATLTAPAVERTFVAPPAVVVAATLRRTPGRPTPHAFVPIPAKDVDAGLSPSMIVGGMRRLARTLSTIHEILFSCI
ncbi:hypothetical protein L218DRAFT_624046 [Marasmius fiardii PR-910]|nr:hypothetical protein L218DRAFT_624046 [Marasmius fiardii PR-910]